MTEADLFQWLTRHNLLYNRVPVLPRLCDLESFNGSLAITFSTTMGTCSICPSTPAFQWLTRHNLLYNCKARARTTSPPGFNGSLAITFSTTADGQAPAQVLGLFQWLTRHNLLYNQITRQAAIHPTQFQWLTRHNLLYNPQAGCDLREQMYVSMAHSP